MKKILKKQWTGFHACRKFDGDLEKAKKFYASKDINLNSEFFEGWKLFQSGKLRPINW